MQCCLCEHSACVFCFPGVYGHVCKCSVVYVSSARAFCFPGVYGHVGKCSVVYVSTARVCFAFLVFTDMFANAVLFM